MSSDFDPYYRWLGIPPDQQPPHHYSLLGVKLFEDDPDVLETAAHRQMGHLRTYQTGPYAPLSQKLLNEVAAAKICLLNPNKKRSYDRALRQRLEAVLDLELPASLAPPAPVAPAASAAAPTPQYYDRLLVEAQAKLSQADVRRLELRSQERTKTAIIVGALVVTLAVAIPVAVFLVWSITAATRPAGEAVSTTNAQGPAASPPQAPQEMPIAPLDGLAPAPTEPSDLSQHPGLLVLPDSAIDKRPPDPGSGR